MYCITLYNVFTCAVWTTCSNLPLNCMYTAQDTKYWISTIYGIKLVYAVIWNKKEYLANAE